jgi:acyl-CoA thioesterase II
VVDAMGDLGVDTAVEGGGGRYSASLSEDWRIWGPFGGYVASVALRAAASEVGEDLQPASLTSQFLSAARFEPVDIDVSTRRSSRRAALVAVSITQEGAPVLDAQAWFTAPAEILEHDHAPPHRYGHPDDHGFLSAHTDRDQSPFWENFEIKPLDQVDWADHEGGLPEFAEWMRFVPTAAFDDPTLEACRLLAMADLPSFPAIARAHPGGLVNTGLTAPSLDLAVQFHRVAGLGEWLLTYGRAPIAHRGLAAFRSEVWTAAGELAATGSGQLAVRGSPPRAG